MDQRDARSSGAFDVRIESPPDDLDSARLRPHLDLRRAQEARLVGTADGALLARHIELARTHRARMRDLPLPDRPNDQSARAVGVATADGAHLDARPAKDPGGVALFGGTGTFVEVRGDTSFRSASLRVRLDDARVGELLPESLRIARWDPDAERFRIVPGSGYVDGFAVARISRPGIYTALGLTRDPAITATLEVFRSMRAWIDPQNARAFVPKICQVILCASPIAGPPGGVCETCLGGAGLGADLDVLDALDLHLPAGALKPVPGIIRRCPLWESVGPDNVPGRISALVAHPTNGQILYAGSAAGGVFTTTNAGAWWSPLWHGQLSLAIGGLAIAPSATNVLYAATGEWVGSGFTINNHFKGVGVYRSNDGGSDWDLVSPVPSDEASAVAVDPTDPDRLYVAGNTGLHRSLNGGRTWDIAPGKTKGVFDGVVTDVVVDPADPLRLYIGVHLDGVYRSTDGGNTWTRLQNVIFTGAAAISPKIALGRAGTHGTKFVAVLMARKVFTSTDGGNTFTQRTDVDPVPWAVFQAPWDSVVAVDPTDEAVLLAGHVALERSIDGGVTWTTVGGFTGSNVHVDQQALAFDPTNHDRVFVATDGGVSRSTDNGVTWTIASLGLVTAQCWTVAVSQDIQLRLAITTQDNNCYQAYFGNTMYAQILPWEGGVVEYEPQDADRMYADTWFEKLKRSTDAGATWTVIEPLFLETETLTISWKPPAAPATHVPRMLAAKSNYANPQNAWVQRSADRGATWVDVLYPYGVFFTAVAFAPSDDQHAYAGSREGRTWRSSNGGQTWTEITATALPAKPIQRIAVDWNDPRRVYIGYGAFGMRQVWRGDVSATNVVTWHDVTGALPAVSLPDLAITGLALDPKFDETIYVANILGVYRTLDGGESWAPFDDGLPNCFVSDLRMRRDQHALYASTMGRGVYVRRL